MSEVSVAEVLTKAADLLEKPGAWTQGAFARDSAGDAGLFGFYDEAVCWCASGALQKIVGRSLGNQPAAAALKGLVGNIPIWNDAPHRTQAEVVSALREAAKSAGEQS